ncbi:cytochrome c [bacterium]|nr:cytochrome c [bacterium]
MLIGERIRRVQQRLSQRGLTMLELVLAMGLLFVSAGGVMTILVAGAGYPRRTQYVVVRDALAKIKLDELISASAAPLDPPTYVPVTANPDYEVKVEQTPSSWDPKDIWVTVSVRGPIPLQVESKISGMVVTSVGSSLFFTTYHCDSCHTVGTGPNGLGPNLNGSALAKGLAARNAALGGGFTLDQYIDESVRNPNAYRVIDPTTGSPYATSMTAYPLPADMPAADVQAISTYLQSL